MKDQIIKALHKASGVKDVQLEHPTEAEHGDYSSNVALVAANKGKNPKDRASEIVKKLQEDKDLEGMVDKIEVAGPGFINFWLANDVLGKELQLALKNGERYGKSKSEVGKKVIVEYTDPNPFKVFHIGHLFSNSVGEALSRLFEAGGAQVKRANYQGDVGVHTAKAIWGIQKMGGLGKAGKSLAQRVKFLSDAYVMGNEAYEKGGEVKSAIEEINKKLYGGDQELVKIWKEGKEWSLDQFEVIYKRLGTKFDFYYFESEVGKDGLELVKDNLKKGIFKEDQGAVIFPGEAHGLHNRVFVSSQGLPTYEAKELGLAPKKYKDFPYDLSIIVTGSEITEYFKVLLKALEKVNPKLAEKTKHVPHGMVRVPGGKMSSRTGDVLGGEWLLDEAKKRLQKSYKMSDEVAEQVAVSAVKYALLKSGIGKDVVFDFDTSLSFEGDSGPYLQYTHARTQSVLAKSKVKSQKSKVGKVNSEEATVLRTFYKFPEVVAESASKLAPNVLCTFLYDLATKYNRLYNTHRILEAESEEAKALRLAITKVTGNILKVGLDLLGIKAPRKM
ncbi:arginine--tRNA ligase [Candidatus Woesebacteria bacterium]|nr:arginine--tRNA ligase [Candidatus Woesebacteria bacterium]